MKKKLLQILALCSTVFVCSQECPDLLSPANGETGVAVDTSIIWEAVDGIPGYQIRLGTAPGLADIAQASVGSATSYTPPLGLPDNTQIYVTIILDFLFEGGDDIICDSLSFTTEDVTTAPGCTDLRTPLNESTGVSVFTNISWNYAPTATGYLLNIGTAPGLNDIENNLDVGNTLSYFPASEFPSNTTIYVEVIPYNENGTAISCVDSEFTTGDVAPLPGCTTLISPINGDTNVSLTPLLEWIAIPGATGYRITIGTTPDGADVLDDAVFTTNSTFVIDFEPNKTFFITITPFNESGDAIGCGQETFSTLLGCGPFLNPDTGEFVDFSPPIDFSPTFSFCENADPLLLTAPPGADGYRWFSVDPFGNESLISEDNEITISENGQYLLEAYRLISQPGTVIECPTVVGFNVVSSEIPTIDDLLIRDTALGLEITVQVSGIGDYEYAIDDANGPYQDSNVFREISPGTHTLYVRDKNGCGIAQETFEQDLTVEGFPKFFTPNGDNTNDFWQFIQPVEGEVIVLQSIHVFDRYGKLIKQIDPNGQGWDGTYLGRAMPAGVFWFKAVDSKNNVIRSHFVLKR